MNIETHTVGDKTFTIQKRTKWTVDAKLDGEVVASDKSKVKLKAKLDEMFKVVEPKKVTKKSSGKKESMRQMTLDLILNGKTDNEILDIVSSMNPEAKYDMSHVKWYRSYFYRANEIPTKFAPKGSKAYKEWAQKNSTTGEGNDS